MTNSNRPDELFTPILSVETNYITKNANGNLIVFQDVTILLSSHRGNPIRSLSYSLYILYNTDMPSSYYDIDAILAEEELVPCSTLFDFTYLSHLDPDLSEKEHFLPESSRIKMPLWSVEKWAMLGFVRLSLPRHYGRKARERLEADPAEADLR